MKKISFVLTCLLPLLAGAQKNFTLNVSVPGIPDNEKVYFFYSSAKAFVKDSAFAKSGQCHFAGVLSEPSHSVLRREKDGKVIDLFSFYIEPGDIAIKGKDSLHTAVVVNSVINNEYKMLDNSTSGYLTQLVDMRMSAQKMTKEALKGEEGKALNARYRLVQDTFSKLQLQFIRTHPNSFVALEKLKGFAGPGMNVDTISSLFGQMPANLKATPTGTELAKVLAKAESTKKGKDAPLFTSFTPEGDTLQLKTLIDQSKLLLVDFWASWCGPCRAENPNVVKAYQKYHKLGFNIISVSLDEKTAPWKAAIAKDSMPWFNGSSLKGWNEPAAVLYGVSAIPDNFLVDANGKIIARGLRGAALDEKLREILVSAPVQ